jgi:hypothetical protein
MRVSPNLDVKRPKWTAAFEALISTIEIVPTVQFAVEVDLVEKDDTILCSVFQAIYTVLVTSDTLRDSTAL